MKFNNGLSQGNQTMSFKGPDSKRPTIGFLIDHTCSQYQFGILQGVSDFAEHHNVNLICFEGGPLAGGEDLKHIGKTLYGLAGGPRLDGVIVLSDSVAIHLDDINLYLFREYFRPLPVLFVGRAHPQVPSIVIDSYTGMKEMVTHLIAQHNHTSFGFIKGPVHSYHAEVRFSAFMEVLKEHAVPVDGELIYDGDFLESSGTFAVRQMLDTYKKQPDVIISCNDEMAVSALHELTRRGIRVPEDVAVVGVDDIPKCATTEPPLTSVRQPLLREGWIAMSLMLKLLEGDTENREAAVPMLTTLDSRLIVRESCGCTVTRNASDAGISFREYSKDENGEHSVSVEQCRTQVEGLLRDISYNRVRENESDLSNSLTNVYMESVRSGDTGVFLDLWREFLSMNFHLEVDEVIIGGMLRYLYFCIHADNASEVGEMMFWAAMSILEKRTLQQIRKTYNTAMREEGVLNQLRDHMDISFSHEEILEVIHRYLVELGIKSAYLVTYDRKENQGDGRLTLAYSNNKRLHLPEDGLVFPAALLIPDTFFKDHDRFSFMAEALYFGERQIGFLILDMSRHINSVHAGIRRIISTNFRSVDLVRKIQQQKTELVDSLGRLKETLEGIIKTLTLAIENRDPYTAGHQRRVAELSIAIGREMHLNNDKLEELRVAALLHDIGKIYIPAEILNRPGKLKPIEFELIKQHAEDGYDTLKNIVFPWPVAEIVYQHHERCDGSGYPLRLLRNETLLAARIIGVADVVEAITSMRPYRAALGLEVAVNEITGFKGTRYDEEVVNVVMKLISEDRLPSVS